MPGPSERTLEPSGGRSGEWRMGGGWSGILVGSPDSEHWSRVEGAVESGGWVEDGQDTTRGTFQLRVMRLYLDADVT